MSIHMFPRLLVAALATSAALTFASPLVHAAVIGGGGSSKTDCLLALDADVNTPLSKPRNIRCADGDPSCDLDGVVNGVCNFRVGVCANSTFNTGACNLNGVRAVIVDHSADDGDLKFDPEFQALQTRINSDIGPFDNDDADSCTTPTNFFVPIKVPSRTTSARAARRRSAS